MKAWGLLFLATVLFARAQPLQRNALVLSVTMEQTVHNDTQWQTGWGDFSADCLNARVLVMDLRRLGTRNAVVTVRWYFIGRDYDRGKLFIYDSGQSGGNIVKGGVKLAATSRELVETREKMGGVSSLTGQHPYGWAVFVEQDGRPLAERGSVPELVIWTQKELSAEEKEPPALSKRKVPFVPMAIR